MNNPYYDEDGITLYHGDCREVTDWLGADVMVTDPPYGIGWTSHGIARTSHKDRLAGDYNGGHRARQRIANDETTEVRDEALRAWGDRPALVFGSLKVPPPPGTRHVAIYVKPSDAGAPRASPPKVAKVALNVDGSVAAYTGQAFCDKCDTLVDPTERKLRAL